MWPVFVRTNLFAQPCHASCAVDGRILIAPPTRNSRPSPALSGATVLSNRLRLPFDYSHIPLFWQRPVFSPTRLLCLSVTPPQVTLRTPLGYSHPHPFSSGLFSPPRLRGDAIALAPSVGEDLPAAVTETARTAAHRHDTDNITSRPPY